MRKTKLILGLAFMALLGILISCDDTTNPAPVITFDDGDTLSLAIGVTSATVTGTVVAEAKMKSALFSKVTDLSEDPIGSAITDFESGIFTSTDDINCTFRLDVDGLTNGMKIKLAATDKDDQVSSKSIVVKIAAPPEETPLSAEQSFTLTYKGASQTDGEDRNETVGILYDYNSSSTEGYFAKLSGDFEIINETKYNSIETKEALKAEYDASTSLVSNFEVGSDANFDPVYFISKVDQNYFLIKMTDLTFSPGDNQADFTYKH
jgi:hypothetical protein